MAVNEADVNARDEVIHHDGWDEHDVAIAIAAVAGASNIATSAALL